MVVRVADAFRERDAVPMPLIDRVDRGVTVGGGVLVSVFVG